MSTEPPGQNHTESAAAVVWEAALWAAAAGGFVLALALARPTWVLLLDGALGTVIALAYAAQQEPERRGGFMWCLLFGLWSATVFQFVSPAGRLAALFPGGRILGPGLLVTAVLAILVPGIITVFLIWPYARRVVGMERRPVWVEDWPVLHLTVVTALAFVIVGAVVALLGQFRQP